MLASSARALPKGFLASLRNPQQTNLSTGGGIARHLRSSGSALSIAKSKIIRVRHATRQKANEFVFLVAVGAGVWLCAGSPPYLTSTCFAARQAMANEPASVLEG
ncbi:hypothetical protein IF2G_04904 [Cordyceps javanica]|nr:hypothetical protein IF2G_04904 [Cordyceps javanica]